VAAMSSTKFIMRINSPVTTMLILAPCTNL
jgi:hypothetical protein